MKKSLQQLRNVGLGATADFLAGQDLAYAATFASTLARCGKNPKHDDQRSALRAFAEAAGVEIIRRTAPTQETAWAA